ncbi:MAG: ATP cone domain-containing protein, partial [Clostridiales bacterium]
MIKRTGAIVPFNPERVANAIYRAAVAVGGRDKTTSELLSQKVIQLLESKYVEGYTPSIEEIQDAVEKVLIENGHAKVAKEYILYREEAARRRQQDSMHFSKPSELIPWAKIWRSLDWAVSHDLHTSESLNKRISKGEFPQIVHEAESAYELQLDTAAEMIKQKGSQLKMVMVSGPSSSGKTTTTLKLEQRLMKMGMRFVPLVV